MIMPANTLSKEDLSTQARNQFSRSLTFASEIGWIGENLFSVERSETKQVSYYGLLSQTGFGTQARNQFSHSLALMAEIGWLRENLFSGFQTGFGLGVRNQFSHSLVLAAEIGFWRLSYAQS